MTSSDNQGICPGCGCHVDSSVSSQECLRCLMELASDDSLWRGESAAEDSPVSFSQPGVLSKFGDYELQDEIARGGMGVVYRARQISLRRTVAIKMILGGQLATPESVRRFQTEAEAAAKLDHPGIVPIYEIGEFETQHYFSMKLIEGGSLADRAGEFVVTLNPQDRRIAHRQQQRIAVLIADVGKALSYAHQRGVLHRDVKPSNILLDENGQPYLTDFGLAKLIDVNSSRLTLGSTVLGSPSYMAPEQATGGSDVTAVADVYGLGAVMYELLCGSAPFAGGSVYETIGRVVNEPPKPLREVNPQIDRDLETIVLKSLKKEPAYRYASAAELAADLARYASGEPITARPIRPAEVVWRWCRRNPWLSGLAAALICTATIGFCAVTFMWQEAVVARQRADVERDNALWQTYFAQMQVASSAIAMDRPDRAQNALEAAPKELRGWEWRHLHSRLNQSQGPFRGDERRHWHIRYIANGRRIFVETTRLGSTGFIVEPPFQSPLKADVLMEPYGSHWAEQVGNDVEIMDSESDRKVATLSDTALADVLSIHVDSHRAIVRRGSEVHVLDIRSGLSVAKLEIASQLVSRAAIRNGAVITYEDEPYPRASIVRIWNPDSGEARTQIRDVRQSTLSSDGKLLVVATEEPENALLVYDTSTGNKTDLANRGASVVGFHDLDVGMDNRYLAVARQNRIELRDLNTKTIVSTLEGHTQPVNGVCFNRDGSVLASGSDDRTIRLWDVPSGQPIRTLMGAEHGLRSIALRPDGSQLAATYYEGGFQVWDLAGPPDVMQFEAPVSHVAVHPSGRHVAVTGSNGKVIVWDHETQRKHVLFECDDGGTLRAGFSPDGMLLAFQVEYFRDETETNAIYVWDFENDRQLHNFSVPRVVAFCNVVFSPDSSLVAAGSQDGVVRVWESRSGKLRAEFGESDCITRHVDFSPDGNVLVAAHANELWLWDLKTNKLIASLKGHKAFIFEVAFSPDGRLLASGSDDHTVRLWDVESLREVAVLQHSNHALCLSFSPDGTRLAVGGRDTGIHLWDVGAERPVATLLGHGAAVNGLAFSPDGTRLYTASSDETLRIWTAPDD